MNITLEEIKSEHEKVAAMIIAFEAQAARTICFPETKIELREGEHYAGIITGKDGALPHHLILLAVEAESINWNDAKAWAEKAGGELPTRREQALLYANLKDQFKGAAYWSGEQHAAGAGYAWCQYFDDGLQFSYDKSAALRARAVRRLIIL